MSPRCTGSYDPGIEIRHMLCANIRNTTLAVLLLLTFALAANAQTPTPTQTPDETVRVATEEIKINILAYDESNKFVDDVRLEDLVVTENNVLHQATSLRRLPANVVIVMDTGGELRQVKTITQTRKTAAALVAALKPADAVAIVEYSDKAEVVSGLTTDRAVTAAAIGKTNFGLGSDFIEAVRLASGLLNRSGVENRHLVLITDGTDSNFTGSARERALRRLLETDINVHVISYTRLEATAIDPMTKSVKTKPVPITEDPIAMPREVAELLPNGTRDFNTSRVGPTISLDRKKVGTWKHRKADLETAESQLTSLTESANGTMVIPATLAEMIAKTPPVAQLIDASYVLTYMPKIPLGEKMGDRIITATSKRDGIVVHGKRRLVVKKNQ
jgi:hypothetical protein